MNDILHTIYFFDVSRGTSFVLVYEFFSNLQDFFMDKNIFPIARNTTKEFFKQSIFFVIIGGGSLLVISPFFFAFFAFGEECRLIKEMGISTLTICNLFLATLGAANTISKEIKDGTIMTLLAKPVNKKTILVGKFIGILSVVTISFFIMGAILILSLCIKESRGYHVSLTEAFASQGYQTMYQLFFSYLQIMIMCSIAIAGSVYLSMVPNLSCCIFIYIVGSLINVSQKLFYVSHDGFAWCISFFYMLFPNIEWLNTIGVTSNLAPNGIQYPVFVTLYAVLYILLVLTVSLGLFERRECS